MTPVTPKSTPMLRPIQRLDLWLIVTLLWFTALFFVQLVVGKNPESLDRLFALAYAPWFHIVGALIPKFWQTHALGLTMMLLIQLLYTLLLAAGTLLLINRWHRRKYPDQPPAPSPDPANQTAIHS